MAGCARRAPLGRPAADSREHVSQLDPMTQMVPGQPWQTTGRRRPPPGLVRAATLAVIGLLIATLLVVEFRKIPYYELSPGPTAPVSALIQVPAADRHPVRGHLLLVTVYQTPLTTAGYLRAKLSSDNQVFPAAAILGNLPASQLLRLDQAEMEQSQGAAEVAALRRLGYTVPEQGTGVLVAGVLPHTPASAKLQLGDTVVALDGHLTPTDSTLVTRLAKLRPGRAVVLTVQNGRNKTRTVSVTLTKRPGDPSVGFLGIETLTRNDHFELPVKVSINAGDIGGPSAGLSFTLGIIDMLTQGNLVGEHTFAATGTIDSQGNVGDVGGVAEKTVSVARAGATLFLVPPPELATAKAHAGPHLQVVAVSNLQQALEAIAAHGGSLAGIPVPPGGLH
jgi:Lon-like protease